MRTNHAPVLISVYNRLEHLENCIDSLARNPESTSTDLYIVSDAACREEDKPGVEAVRQNLAKISGFNRVVPILRENNQGSYFSIKNAIEEVLAEQGRVIFLEDDNLVSGNFLNYMNDCLEFYSRDESIFSISAYQFPIELPESYLHTLYKWQGFNAWGVGLWKVRWEKVKWDWKSMADGWNNRSERKKIDQVDEHLNREIGNAIRTGRMTLDILISHYVVMNNLYSIFPARTRIRNTGHDGSGDHCGMDPSYGQQAIEEDFHYSLVEDLKPDDGVNWVMWDHYRIPIKSKIKDGINRFFHPVRN